jgi:hypothetical protein
MFKQTVVAHGSGVVLGLLFASSVLSLTRAQAQNGNVVWTQHNDNNRDGVNASEVTLTTANVNQTDFGMIFKDPVDDQVYAQPLVDSNVSIAGGTHNVVYVATTGNSVYAFDANSGIQYWHVNFGTPATVTQLGFTCLDMLATTGIVGTPVIDTANNSLYVVDQLYNGGNPIHQLHSLNISTGADNSGSPVTISANEFVSKDSLQRPALLYANGNIYISFGGHCDQGSWKGLTFAYSASTLAQVGVFNPSPNDNGASIWQSGNGPATDSSGNVYVITGNGTWDGSSDFSETMLKLNSSLNSLEDWYTPTTYQSLDSGDTDLTTSGDIMLPNNLVIGGGKDGWFNLVKTTDMGHLGGYVQRWEATSNHIHSVNFFNNNLYLWGQSDYLRVYNFNGSTFNTTPTFKGTQQAIGHPGASLSISANGTSNGILWATTNTAGASDGNGAWHGTEPGILYAYNLSGMGQIYNNEQNPTRDDCGNYAKFAPPTIANGMVYLPSFGTASTLSGALCVYGELKSTSNLIPNGTYEVISVGSGMALESPGFSHTNGLDMDQWTVNGGSNQLWSVINLGDNIITLTNSYSSQVLDVAAASKTAGALVDQWPNNNQASNQEWQVISLGGGEYELTSVNSGLALDVVGASKSTGAKIDQYGYNGGGNQKWTFTAKP